MVHTADSLSSGLKEAAGLIRAELLDKQIMMDKFNAVFDKVMAQGGLDTFSLNNPWQDFMNSISPKNYSTDNNYREITLGDTNIDLYIHGVTGDEVVQKIKQELPNIANFVKESQGENMRKNGVVNRGSTALRRNL